MSPLQRWWERKGFHYRRSLASRVALLTTLTLGVSVAFIAATAFVVMRMQIQSSLDQSLLNRATKAASYPALAEITAQKVPGWMLGAADVRVAFIDTSGNVLSADSGPDVHLGAPERRVVDGRSEQSIRTVTADGGVRYRVAAVPWGNHGALVLMQPMADTDRTLRKLGVVLLLFSGAGVVIAAIGGWAVARNGLRPVRRLTQSVEQVARTQDLRPMPVEGADEIARLTTAFNQMLTALSVSRDRERRLIADAGHELRTPLTSLRTNIDLLTQAGDGLPSEARAELLDDVRGQLEELSTLVGDLVELARDEQLTHVITEVDLAEVVERALARVRRRALTATFDVSLEPWTVRGEASTLERAVTNLLDNAVKWSPEDGTVTVTLRDGVLTVDDEGPGIDEADRPHVFDRFYRSDDSRSMPGSGLGLAIVQQAAQRHAGAVRADRAPGGGARLVMWVPGVAGAMASQD
ncbi:sensor histidine kinase [Nocardioides jishulii]|uniref:histidine kinase n=1 Tax=Nocardioides jishulii TaxID=2575440 RepID=A0A4U2YRD7_9ACTN|nr:HAMP domain-containing sensor histidine kinase [Nocardioides jishulii]QCX26258.1 HAMP domain-containing histidine kinase [Nocardioides jishulii]TKI63938.1 HAMP domain-containing histidine kinase [Nocardioides jishulii]